MVDEGMPEPSLDAQVSVVGSLVGIGADLHQGVALDLELDLAAGPAVRTGRGNRLYLFDLDGNDPVLLVESAGGAVLNAFAAGNALVVEHYFQTVGPAVFVHLACPQFQGVIFAVPFTAAAEDALVAVDHDGRMGIVDLVQGLDAHAGLKDIDVVFDVKPFQLAPFIGAAAAGQAAGRLADRHFFRVAELDFVKVLDGCFRRALGHFFPQLDVDAFKILQIDVVKGFAPGEVEPVFRRFLVTIHDKGVDVVRRPPGSDHGLDDRFRAGHGVAAGEDPVDAGLGAPGIGDNIAFGGQFDPGLDLAADEMVLDRHLSQGGNNGVDKEGVLGARDGDRLPAAAFIRLAQLHPDQVEPQPAVLLGWPAYFDGGGHEQKLDAFPLRLADIALIGRHFDLGPGVDDGDVVDAQAQKASGDLHGRVVAADDRRPPAQFNVFPFIDQAQELDGAIHMGLLGTWDFQRFVNAGADADEHRVKTLVPEIPDGEMPAPFLVQADGDAHPEDGVDFVLQDLPGNTVLRVAVAQGSSQLGSGFENGDVMPPPGEKIGGGQPGRPPADHRDPLACRFFPGDVQVDLVGHAPVGNKALEMVDVNRVVNQNAPAAGFAEPGADPAHGERYRIALHDQAQGFFVFALGDVGDVALNVDLSRAGKIAGSLAVAEMGAGDGGQPLLAEVGDGPGCRRDVHAVQGKGGTGPEKTLDRQDRRKTVPPVISHFDNTDVAGVVGQGSLDVTEGGDCYAGALGDFKDGQSLFGKDFIAVDGQLYSGHTLRSGSGPAGGNRPAVRRSSPLVSIWPASIPSERQADVRLPLDRW